MIAPMSATTEPTTNPVIAPGTTIGAVHLTVRDLDRSRAFYELVLGMRASEQTDGTVALSPSEAGATAGGDEPLLHLHPNPAAAPLDRGRTGLFHFAVLVPDRRELALALLRLAQERWPLDGASDHLVSEALYLSDPEGNGIEIYRDRPRSEWRRDASGALEMATLPLDLDDIIAEVGPDPLAAAASADADHRGLPAGTKIGHVHLQVAELAAIERFYAGVLGFDVMVRGYPGALFVAAGGYHHHIGLNTWHSRGAAAPAPGSAGLLKYEVRVGDPAALADVLARAQAAGLAVDTSAGAGAMVRDPSGNAVLLRA
jgi:catechol 2,3-dioxygenase